MNENLVFQIWEKNKKILSYGEISHLLQTLQTQKPQFKDISFICSEHQWSSKEEEPFTVKGAIILLRVYDEKEKIKKSLKVFFRNHFRFSLYVEEILNLFQIAKSFIRKDLILQIYDVYHLKFNERCNIYFVIEQEDVQCNLQDMISIYNKNEQQINQIMETAINYCQNCTLIQLKLSTKKLSFPKQFLKYFYLSNQENGDLSIKLNVLDYEIFTNPHEEQEYLQDSQTPSSISQSQYNMEDINSKLSKLLINLKQLEVIKSEDFIETIKSYQNSLLKHHDLQLFEIICQHPKYEQFELIEYDEEFIILAVKMQGQNFYLKLEKFENLKEAEQQLNEYHTYNEALDNMLVPIENVEILLLENNSIYLLIEEKMLPYQRLIKNEKQKPQILNNQIIFMSTSKKEAEKINKLTSYNTLEFIILNASDAKIDQLRILQIIVQLIKFITKLYKNRIYHGRINTSNIIVYFPVQFSQKPPNIYFQNPLFMRNKKQKNKCQKDLENDKEEMNLILYCLIHQIYNTIIDIKALKLFKRDIYRYFDYLNEYYISKQDNQLQSENEQIFLYIQKLEDLFGVFEQIYKNQWDDKHVKINKKWMISVNKYQGIQKQFGYYVYNDNQDDDEINQFQQYDFFSDSGESDSDSDSEYGVFKSKYDQCRSTHVFELNIEKISYDFESHMDEQAMNKIESISKNKSLKSLHIKGYKFQKISSMYFFLSQKPLDQNSKQYLENLLINCSSLKKLKLEIKMEEYDSFDLSGIKQMKELEFLKLKFSCYLDCSRKNEYKDMIQMKKQFYDFIEIFQYVRNLKVIDFDFVCTVVSSFQHLDFIWYFEKQKLICEQIVEKKQLKNDDTNENNQNQLDFDINFLINDKRIQQIIADKNMEVLDLNTVINIANFYLSFQNQEQEIVQESKNWLIENLTLFLQKNKFISCTSFLMYQNDTQLLVLEFQNILDFRIGSLSVYLQFTGQMYLLVNNFKCRSLNRFKCQQKNQIQNFLIDIVVYAWLQCEYETNIKEQLFNSKFFQFIKNNSVQQGKLKEHQQENEQEYVSDQSCKHLDYMLYQMPCYQNQINLQKLTYHFYFCDAVLQNLIKSKDFFRFSYFNTNTLLELHLKIYSEDKLLIRPHFFQNLRRHIEEAKSLVKITLDLNQNNSQIAKRQLQKLRRVVFVKFLRKR